MNKYADAAMIQFEVTEANYIVYRMIEQLITTKDDLHRLHAGLVGRSNKIYKVLCDMRRANNVRYAVGYIRSTGTYVYGQLEAVNEYLQPYKSRQQSIVNAPLTWIYNNKDAMERKIQATVNTCSGMGDQDSIPVQIVGL